MSDKKKLKVDISVVPEDFYESIFFSEIEYKNHPSKVLKNKLISLYIQAVDYHTAKNENDISLYFQNKLLHMLQRQDDLIKVEINEEEQNKKIEEIVNDVKKIEKAQNDALNNDMKKQKEKFLGNLYKKKRVQKLKKQYSSKISDKEKEFKFKHIPLLKKNSIDISKKVNDKILNTYMNIVKYKKKENDSIFDSVDNCLKGFNKINSFLIVEYSKKLKEFAKQRFDLESKAFNKYLNYKGINNDINMLYENCMDEKNDEAKKLKEQIAINQKELDKFNNDCKLEEKIIQKNISKIINSKDIKNLDSVLDDIFNKIQNLIKNNKIK